jgi:hydroxymethyl cephem carbamoyltransferase
MDVKIVGVNTYHDAAIATAIDGRLISYIEVSKDNGPRYGDWRTLTLERLHQAFIGQHGLPDTVAVGGWRGRQPGYFGVDAAPLPAPFFATQWPFEQRATTHERAHVLCSYAMSPFEQGEPCYALVYEGTIGSFYRVDEQCRIEKLSTPIVEPGHRYAAVYELADDRFAGDARGLSADTAGKLMALAVSRNEVELTTAEKELLRKLLDESYPEHGCHDVVVKKEQLKQLPHWNVGHGDHRYRNFAATFSRELFERFHAVAKATLTERLPLLISGGCGLNCGWNTQWRDSGLFREVFVPPCPDDSGIAVGVAADAQLHYTGSAKLQWDTYCGDTFVHDVLVPSVFKSSAVSFEKVSALLADGAVVAWVQGKMEIGPRALGNRSLLAHPFSKGVIDKLNHIKKRETYRPVAPVCLEEEVSRWFDWKGSSPHMLYFQKVRSDRIPAVTHTDDSARVQTVRKDQNAPLYGLLKAFSAATGVGVLCNTSLNFPGRGFINRTSDLVRYVVDRQLDAFVIDDRMYTR